MRRSILLALALTLTISCAKRTSQLNENVNALQSAPLTPQSATTATANDADVASKSGHENSVPPKLVGIDFNNFSYPASIENGVVQLKDGSYEYRNPEGVGGDTFDLGYVTSVDLAGDERKESLAQLHRISCGASCDGGSDLFYVYSNRPNGKPALFWRIESGSLAYGCGLKSFTIQKRTITVELFNKCRFKGVTPESEPGEGETGNKFSAKFFTRFLFESDGKKVALKKREVFPFPQGDTKNYSPAISISND